MISVFTILFTLSVGVMTRQESQSLYYNGCLRYSANYVYFKESRQFEFEF
jgi:hypothetical protein